MFRTWHLIVRNKLYGTAIRENLLQKPHPIGRLFTGFLYFRGQEIYVSLRFWDGAGILSHRLLDGAGALI